MQYMKTCGTCNQKRNEVATKNCTEAEKESPEKSKQHALRKDKSVDGPPMLTWDEFISLLVQNKDKPYELHASVVLNETASEAPKWPGSDDRIHDLSVHLAKLIWTTTGYRFK
jgi:hypothetical protein